MIANFFQSLEQNGVEYLLISGQATVLYGAATFSEDIDLWIHPTEKNRNCLTASLIDCQACYYKLTPPLTMENLQYGHGFHFILPDRDAGEVFLDVMGKPPRVGPFTESLETSKWMETEWGTIRTVGIKPLVELKKTQRLEDYPIIGRLAAAWFDQEEAAKTEAEYLWASQNIFTLPEWSVFFSENPDSVDVISEKFGPEVGDFGRQLLSLGEVSERIESRVSEMMQSRISLLQQSDRRYWRGVIRELKELRQAGKLMREGGKVSSVS